MSPLVGGVDCSPAQTAGAEEYGLQNPGVRERPSPHVEHCVFLQPLQFPTETISSAKCGHLAQCFESFGVRQLGMKTLTLLNCQGRYVLGTGSAGGQNRGQ